LFKLQKDLFHLCLRSALRNLSINIEPWRTEIPAKFINSLGLQKLMFEAADPQVFAWYIKNYGPEVNVFVDHSQIVQLEALRQGIWGTKSLWGRVLTYKG
jgi:phosphosulfolactate synthase (CoM biosynthesis protein A)